MHMDMNWDQTGIKFVPNSSWTMARHGAKRVELVGVGDKRQITAVFCGSLLGDLLPVQVIYKGKTSRCHPRFSFPLDWHITHSPNHWSTEETTLQYIDHIIVPYVKKMRETVGDNAAALVIMDRSPSQSANFWSQILSMSAYFRPTPQTSCSHWTFQSINLQKNI